MKHALILAAAVTVVPAIASSIQPDRQGTTPNATQDITGIYDCRGLRGDGAAYRGIVEIVPHKGVYQVVWTFGDGERHLGIGIVNGNVLAVSYFGGTPGVVAYRIEQSEKGAQLIGQWTVADADGYVFGETLTRLSREASHPRMPEPAPRTPQPRPGRLLPSRSLRSA